ncbi:hypothetical protein BJX96DRAFT_145722 [Aspergillus floccosus]
MTWSASLFLGFLTLIFTIPPSVLATMRLYGLLRPRLAGPRSEQEMLPVTSQDMSRRQYQHFLLLESISVAHHIEAWIARIYQVATTIALKSHGHFRRTQDQDAYPLSDSGRFNDHRTSETV